MSGQPVSIALGGTPISRRFIELVGQEGVIAPELHKIRPIHRAFRPMVMEQAYDISELAIVTALQAIDHRKPLVLLPVTLAARFQHRCIVQNGEKTSLAPGDLRGRRVAVRAYSQTTGTWVRTILEMEFGVPADSIEWVTQEAPHVREAIEPPFVTRDPNAAPPDTLLREGKVDAAIFGNDMPKEDWVRSVIPDADSVARDTYDRSGVIPINHIVAVTRAFARNHPELVRYAYECFGTARTSVADPTGPDFLPFGAAAIRPSVEALLRYARSQQLIERPLTFDDLFAEGAALAGVT